jgi:hypothetical protein
MPRWLSLMWQICLTILVVFVSLILLFTAIYLSATPAHADVFSVEKGQPAPASGVLLDDDHAKRVADELERSRALSAEVENLKAKLSESDARSTDQAAQIAALTEAYNAQADQFAKVTAALDQKAKQDAAVLEALANTTKALASAHEGLEAARKELERAGKRSVWWYLWEGVKTALPVFVFFALH